MVVTRPLNGGSPAGKGQQECRPDMGEESPLQGAGQGHRKQLMVTMAGKKVTMLLCSIQLNVKRNDIPQPLHLH